MPIPPPPELFERQPTTRHAHWQGPIGLLIGFTGFYVAHHANAAIQFAFALSALFIGLMGWRSRDLGTGPLGTAVRMAPALLGLGLGWSLAWLVRVLAA